MMSSFNKGLQIPTPEASKNKRPSDLDEGMEEVNASQGGSPLSSMEATDQQQRKKKKN